MYNDSSTFHYSAIKGFNFVSPISCCTTRAGPGKNIQPLKPKPKPKLTKPKGTRAKKPSISLKHYLKKHSFYLPSNRDIFWKEQKMKKIFTEHQGLLWLGFICGQLIATHLVAVFASFFQIGVVHTCDDCLYLLTRILNRAFVWVDSNDMISWA